MENNTPLSKSAQEQIKNITEEEARKAQWHNEMMASEAIRNYLNQYSERSAENFVDQYIFYKNLWYKHGELYGRLQENEALRFDTAARKYLTYIQQKKLFDLQCNWRAGNLQISGVDICWDFLVWGDDILNCPFIEPITEDDLELCSQYLYKFNGQTDEYWSGTNWQEYESIKMGYETDNEEGEYPDFYEFIDERKGTGLLLQLPDLKGSKEEFYRTLVFAARREADAASQDTQEPPIQKEEKPFLFLHATDELERFVMTFESKEMRRLYKSYTWQNRNRDAMESVYQNIEFLISADEDIPVEANHNWMNAIELAVQKCKARKTAESLAAAWEQYMINIQTGIAFPKERQIHEELRDQVAEQILTGRKLNGEPADFNF